MAAGGNVKSASGQTRTTTTILRSDRFVKVAIAVLSITSSVPFLILHGADRFVGVGPDDDGGGGGHWRRPPPPPGPPGEDLFEHRRRDHVRYPPEGRRRRRTRGGAHRRPEWIGGGGPTTNGAIAKIAPGGRGVDDATGDDGTAAKAPPRPSARQRLPPPTDPRRRPDVVPRDKLASLTAESRNPSTGPVTAFRSGPACESIPPDDGERECKLHRPFVDLSLELENEEAYELARNLPASLRMQLGYKMHLQRHGAEIRAKESAIRGTYPSPVVTERLTRAEEAAPEEDGKAGARPLTADPDMAVLTRRGYKGGLVDSQINQDRVLILSPFPLSAEPPSSKKGRGNDEALSRSSPAAPPSSSSRDLMMGIFDGHGTVGHVVSHAIASDLPKALAESLVGLPPTADDETVKRKISETFVKFDEDLPNVSGAGATVSVFLRRGRDKLYAANVGDSKSFLASYSRSADGGGKNVTVVYETKEHKPADPIERRRIESAGGEVMIPPSRSDDASLLPKDSSRVVVPMPGGTMMGAGSMLALAMSRSFGDVEAKGLGVIAEPTVDVLDLAELWNRDDDDDVELFAVSASDGLYDRLGPMEIATRLAEAMVQSGSGSTKRRTSSSNLLLAACEELIMKSSALWISRDVPYRDDISIAVGRIKR